jgi:hypothetical protein
MRFDESSEESPKGVPPANSLITTFWRIFRRFVATGQSPNPPRFVATNLAKNRRNEGWDGWRCGSFHST